MTDPMRDPWFGRGTPWRVCSNSLCRIPINKDNENDSNVIDGMMFCNNCADSKWAKELKQQEHSMTDNDQITRDSDRVDRFRRRLVKAEAQVKHLTEVTAMHRRIIDMLVKDMLQVMPRGKRMVCDNSDQFQVIKEQSND